MELLRGDRAVVRVGHRGAALLAPDNSLEAITAAVAHGADVVELDVVRGRDGLLVLAHEPPVPPDAPTLDAGLAQAARLRVGVQLDVKTPGLEREIVAALRRHALLERSFVSSFSAPILRAFAAAAPGLPRSLTYPEDRHGLSENPLVRPLLAPSLAVLRAFLPLRLPRLLRAVDARAATLNAAVVSRRAVAVCHERRVAVYVWTVNDPELAKTLLRRGVDGIITDDPRLVPPPTPPPA